VKVAFAHMGYLYVNMGAFARSVGAKLCLAPTPSRQSLALGVRHSPEQYCIPFKVNLGDLITSLEAGAEVLLSVQGGWSCRFGYYGRLHHAILRDLGYKFESLILGGSPKSIKNIAHYIRRFSGLHSNAAAVRVFLRAMRLAYRKGALLQLVQTHARAIRPRETRKGDADRLVEPLIRRIDATDEYADLDRIKREIVESFAAIPIEKDRVCPRIMIVGEVYIVLEPLLNMNTERRLGRLGAVVDSFIDEHIWLMHPFGLGIWGKYRERHAHRLATPYLKYNLGGEDKNTLGYTIIAARRGFDGVVHFKPFTCMPEGLAKHILYNVSEDHGIPFVSFTVDEHSGEAGHETRLEAFYDMVEQRALARAERGSTHASVAPR